MVKQFVIPVVIIFSLLILLQSVHGISPATITWVNELTGESGAATDSDTTEGGNITFLNLDSQQSTNRWAGYVGNVSGSLTLSDGSAVFYRWGNASAQGSVCAGIANNYNWSMGLYELSDVRQVDQAWGFSGGTDLAINTFNETPDPPGGYNDLCGDIAGNALSNVNSSKTGPDNQAGDTFETCVINDQNATSNVSIDMIFCTLTDRSSSDNDYRNRTSDYELIVPVTEGGTETYYFFLEI